MPRPLLLDVKIDTNGEKKIEKVQGKLQGAQHSAWNLGKTLGHTFASATFLKGLTAFQSLIGETTEEVIAFNRKFKELEGLTNTGEKSMEKLKDMTVELSNSTEHFTQEIGEAALQITKMGFDINETLKMVPSISDLATSSMIELGDAARYSAQTLKSFNLPATEFDRVVNTMQGAIAKTSINFENFAENVNLKIKGGFN